MTKAQQGKNPTPGAPKGPAEFAAMSAGVDSQGESGEARSRSGSAAFRVSTPGGGHYEFTEESRVTETKWRRFAFEFALAITLGAVTTLVVTRSPHAIEHKKIEEVPPALDPASAQCEGVEEVPRSVDEPTVVETPPPPPPPGKKKPPRDQAAFKDPTVATASKENCEFQIGQLPGKRLTHAWAHGGDSIPQCETAIKLTCTGLAKRAKYNLLAGGTVSVATNNLPAYGTWPKWLEVNLKGNGVGTQPCSGLKPGYSAEHYGDHSVNLCGQAYSDDNGRIEVELCYHRCKQGNDNSTCTLGPTFTVSVAPAR